MSVAATSISAISTTPVGKATTSTSTSDIYLTASAAENSAATSAYEVSTQIAKDLVALGRDTNTFSSLSKSMNPTRLVKNISTYLSEIEAAILRSKVPIDINETEEITVHGQTGIFANKSEIVNWKGDKLINEYPINEDNEPQVITKKGCQDLEYVQELAIRYLKPPTPPVPGEIVITQEANSVVPPAPPLIIRQQPPRPCTPEPVIIREAPPQPPNLVGRKLITISGKQLPPPPRKVVIERLAPIPSKPQSVVVERWLPYNDCIKRRVIYQKPPPDPVICKPKNIIVQWEAPNVNIRQEVKYLGVVRANPADYVERYGDSLQPSDGLPVIVNKIQTPEGIVLAANHVHKNFVPVLDGDIEGLSLVDLDKEGLAEYKLQLDKLGIKYLSSGNANANGSTQIEATSANNNNNNNNINTDTNNTFQKTVETVETIVETTLTTTTTTTSGSGSGSVASASASMSPESLAIIDNVFAQIDTNNDGNIEVGEAERIFLRLNSRLGRSYGENDVRYFFNSLDTNKDGKIDLAEFRTVFKKFNFNFISDPSTTNSSSGTR